MQKCIQTIMDMNWVVELEKIMMNLAQHNFSPTEPAGPDHSA